MGSWLASRLSELREFADLVYLHFSGFLAKFAPALSELEISSLWG
jgi:hypothetical protein